MLNSGDEAPKYIAHILTEYLGHPSNWIYTQIKYTQRYIPYVLAQRVVNLDHYPLERIFVSRKSGKSSGSPSFAERIVRRLGFLPRVDFQCFSSALERYPPLLLQAHFGWDGYFSLGLKKKHGLPQVTRFYGYDVGILPRIPLWRRRYQRLFGEGDLFIVEGTNMKSLLENAGCPSGKIVVHHLGVNLDQIKYEPRKPQPKALRVLIAASFKEKKGIEYALKAIARAGKEMPDMNIHTTIIGDGVLKKTLHDLAGELGILGAIAWTGYQPHGYFLEELYKADLFLSPSVTASDGDTEGGAPVAIIEAGASGLPVISTTHADIPEVVLNGCTGFLAAERNVESLAESICRLARDPAMRMEFGRRARAHIEANYECVRQGKLLSDIYAKYEK